MSTVSIFPDRFGYRKKANEIRAHMIMLRTEQAAASNRLDWIMEATVFAVCTMLRSVRCKTSNPVKFKRGGPSVFAQQHP